jgi:hypothetical protein
MEDTFGTPVRSAQAAHGTFAALQPAAKSAWGIDNRAKRPMLFEWQLCVTGFDALGSQIKT